MIVITWQGFLVGIVYQSYRPRLGMTSVLVLRSSSQVQTPEKQLESIRVPERFSTYQDQYATGCGDQITTHHEVNSQFPEPEISFFTSWEDL